MIGSAAGQAYFYLGYELNVYEPSESARLFYLDPHLVSSQAT